ncbi:CobN component of cobalt chelatase [Cutibacterium acnes JCM 18918]|nr:CobN component of cobalt chelatase [Cutibacterium acnes JCM 18918]
MPFFCLRLPDARRGNPSMAQTLETLLRDDDGNRVIDTLIDVHGMSMTAGVPANADAYPKLGVSVLHALTSYAPLAAWKAQGMGAMDVATQAAQPEFDGASSLNSWPPEKSIGSTISPEPSYHTWSQSPAAPRRWPNWPFRGPGWPAPPPTNAKWRSSSTTIRRVMTGSAAPPGWTPLSRYTGSSSEWPRMATTSQNSSTAPTTSLRCCCHR